MVDISSLAAASEPDVLRKFTSFYVCCTVVELGVQIRSEPEDPTVTNPFQLHVGCKFDDCIRWFRSKHHT